MIQMFLWTLHTAQFSNSYQWKQ